MEGIKMVNTTDTDVAIIEKYLKIARKHKLEAEVVWSAFRYWHYARSGSIEGKIGWDMEKIMKTACNDWDIL